MSRLSTGALLIATLLMCCPVLGQSMAQMSVQTHSASMSKTSFEAMPYSQLDLPEVIAGETAAQRGFSAAGFATALIEILASQNAITLEEMPSSSMDAFLRPPRGGSDDSGLFRQAKNIYDSATTMQSRSAEVILDPLKMRCSLRIKLNRLLSN